MSLKSIFGSLRGVGTNLVEVPKQPVVHAVPPDPFQDKRWAMLRDNPPCDWDLAAMYDAEGPVSETPLVGIAAPHYRESAHVARICGASRNAVRMDLQEHGLGSMFVPLEGDSLIVRMRQMATHFFLMSSATHLLFWDGDICCMTPGCVRGMLASGHDVIAGACPFKDDTGRTVHNLWPEDDGKPKVVDGCVEVRDAGTGFLMISRRALLHMQKSHPELLHWSRGEGITKGIPLWALFNTPIVAGEFLSEDYYFCHLWQELGGKVYVYVPAVFEHFGEYGYKASFVDQYKLGVNE